MFVFAQLVWVMSKVHWTFHYATFVNFEGSLIRHSLTVQDLTWTCTLYKGDLIEQTIGACHSH